MARRPNAWEELEVRGLPDKEMSDIRLVAIPRSNKKNQHVIFERPIPTGMVDLFERFGKTLDNEVTGAKKPLSRFDTFWISLYRMAKVNWYRAQGTVTTTRALQEAIAEAERAKTELDMLLDRQDELEDKLDTSKGQERTKIETELKTLKSEIRVKRGRVRQAEEHQKEAADTQADAKTTAATS